MIELYEFAISGNCHKVRLLLSILGLEYRSILVSGADREQKQPEFLRMNPFGQVPVLVDDGFPIRDSHAILMYLAENYGGAQWWPNDAKSLAAVMPWLFTAANEIARGPAAARAYKLFSAPWDYDRALTVAGELFAIMDAHLQAKTWLALNQPTLADVACYPYVALAHEGDIDVGRYPAITNWLTRFQALPGYVRMPGL